MNLTRRRLLASVLGGTGLVGSGKAVDNVFLGYGTLSGTNLLEQDLDALVSESLRPVDTDVRAVEGPDVAFRNGVLEVHGGEAEPITLDPATDDPADAAAVDDDRGLDDGPLEQLLADVGALDSGDVRFTYGSYPDVLETVAASETRPYTISALRGRRTADPAVVETFTGGDPSDPEAVIEGLVGGFREHTYYDVPRYVAGSVEDNVLFGARDVRRHFESETDFAAMLDGRDTGLFCYELVRRSVEALQAVPTTDQAPPVFAGFVKDTRHKHVYTVVASAIREDGDLVVPVTFLDYTHTTLYRDLRVRWLLGEGLDAYGDSHRVEEIRWYR